MAVEGGDAAGPIQRITDADSQNYTRYEVETTNPLKTTEVGYIYLYRSTTLAPTYDDSVNWN